MNQRYTKIVGYHKIHHKINQMKGFPTRRGPKREMLVVYVYICMCTQMMSSKGRKRSQPTNIIMLFLLLCFEMLEGKRTTQNLKNHIYHQMQYIHKFTICMQSVQCSNNMWAWPWPVHVKIEILCLLLVGVVSV